MGPMALFLYEKGHLDWVEMREQIDKIIEPAITALGFELWGYELSIHREGSLLRVYVDGEHGVTMDDCSRLSRQISAALDVSDPISGHYNLEVSSPGLDRPLYTLAHYQRYIGQSVKLRLRLPQEGQRNFKGIIVTVREDEIILAIGDDKQLTLHVDAIEKARLMPEF